MSLRSNTLKHRVQLIAQLNGCVEGHALAPLGAQLLNHFLKPYSLRLTCLNTRQQLLGHAQLSTTSIYADAMGPEKRQLVERMWT